jgi:hypothetical protein
LKECDGKPAMNVVKVSSDFHIQNARIIEEWLSNTRRCADANHVFWISKGSLNRPAGEDSLLDDVGRFTVFEKVRQVYESGKEKMPIVVFSDSSGHVPLRPQN